MNPKRYRKRNLSEADLKIIHNLVSRKAGRDGVIPENEAEDVEHDIIRRLVAQIPKFDPDINSWKAFRAVVVYHALTDVIRKFSGPDFHRNRDIGFSIDDPVPESNARTPLVYRDLINSDGIIADGTERGESERWARIIDVRLVVAGLSEELRLSCQTIMEFNCRTPLQLAAALRISRATAYRRFTEIRRALVSHGITG